MATLPIRESSKYATVFESQSIDDFKRQANKIAKCNKKLIWEKKSLEPVVDTSSFNLSKYITNNDKSSKVAMIWAQVYTDKIIKKSELLSLSPPEIDLFKKVQETFISILSPASKNGAMKNYKEAGNAFDCLLYRIGEQQSGEQLRVWNKAAAATEDLREMMLEGRASSAVERWRGGEGIKKREGDVSGGEEITDGEITDGESDEVESGFQASELKLSPNKYSKLTKSFCTVSVVAVGILLTMLYKYNE
ncbi:MAG: hypothetical protein K940chlam5_00283 [Candidatus Anoxychlamydiales bacterium]|nr:hypothetical protein [Candidatus Anoxychlamydiales bacterium]